MTGRFAILVDGGFMLKKLSSKTNPTPSAEDIARECERIKSHPSLAGHSLLRIYYYDAPPSTEVLFNPIDHLKNDLGASRIAIHNTSMLDALELKPDFALRLGETVAMGWRLGDKAAKDITKNARILEARDFVPNIKQKGVDLRIALDIARLSLRQLVDIIVVVTGDSDFVPAFKFARREGIRVYLDHMGHGVKRALKAHVDLVF